MHVHMYACMHYVAHMYVHVHTYLHPNGDAQKLPRTNLPNMPHNVSVSPECPLVDSQQRDAGIVENGNVSKHTQCSTDKSFPHPLQNS